MIVTLTLNPSVDLAASVEQMAHGRKLRCAAAVLEPGGGGVNVSRVIKAMGGQSACLFTMGGPMGEALSSMLLAQGVDAHPIPIDEWCRQNFSLTERKTGRQFRFVLPGPRLRPSEWRSALQLVERSLAEGSILVFSGSLPPGVPVDFCVKLVEIARAKRAFFAVDSSGPALRAALRAGVDFIKPNRHEFRELDRTQSDDWRTIARASRRWVDQGLARAVLATRGADGALLTEGADQWRIEAPKVAVKSAIGAGDSCMGAIAFCLERGLPLLEACRIGIAAAAAAMLTPATGLARKRDVARLSRGVAVWRFKSRARISASA